MAEFSEIGKAIEEAISGLKGQQVLRPAEKAAAAAVAPKPVVPGMTARGVPIEGAVDAGAQRPVAQMPVPPPGAETAPPGPAGAGGTPPGQPPQETPPGQLAADAALPTQQGATPTDLAGTVPEPRPGLTEAPGTVASDPVPPVGVNKLPAGARIKSIDPVTGAPTVRLPDGSEQVMHRPATIEERVTRITEASMPDFEGKLNMIHMPNVDTVSPDSIKPTILQLADDNKDAIEAARGGGRADKAGGVVSDDQLIALAQDYTTTHDMAKEIMERVVGTAADRPEVRLAVRMYVNNRIANLRVAAGNIARDGGSPEDWVRMYNMMKQEEALLVQSTAQAAESGRMLRAESIPVSPDEQLNKRLADIMKNNMDNPELVARMFTMANTPNGARSIINGWALMPSWQKGVALASNLWQRVFINGLLSGLSLVRVMTGNTANLARENFNRVVAGFSHDAAEAAFHGGYLHPDDKITLADAVANMHGQAQAWGDAWRVFSRVIRYGKSMDELMRDLGRTSETASKAGRARIGEMYPQWDGTLIGNLIYGLDRALDFPGTLIGASDDLIKTISYRGHLTMQAVKQARNAALRGELQPNDIDAFIQKGMNTPDAANEQAAELAAHATTFQTPFYIKPDGSPGSMQTMTQLINKAPPLRIIFPFMRTAYNIASQGMVESNPLLAGLSARVRADIAAGGASRQMALAKMATGTTFISAAAWGAVNGRITGGYPRDPKERQLWIQEGIQPYSVRVPKYGLYGPDVWLYYGNIEPIATMVGLAADSVAGVKDVMSVGDGNTLQDHESRWNTVQAHIAASAIENFGNKLYMQGAAKFMQLWNDPQEYMQQYEAELAANMQPYSAFTKMLRHMTDPYLREAHTIMDHLKDQLPFESKDLEMKLDWFGQPRQPRAENPLQMISPMPATPAKSDAVLDEVHNIMDRTRTVPINMPQNHLNLLGGDRGIEGGASGMKLTDQEYRQLTRAARAEPLSDGKTFHQRLENLIQSPMYQGANPNDRSTMITNETAAANKEGAAWLWNNNSGFQQRMIDWQNRANRITGGAAAPQFDTSALR